ncbi:hypothetical protein VDGD_20194 [Verticillium dahliae]|nr:hypothetical protein VDGD_20194 [Verticillium dahliae]
MSSPNYGFSPWRRRASSLSTQTQPTDDAQPTPINRPNRNALPPNSDSLRQLSSSTGQREPIRSFIHGSVRDDLGKSSPPPVALPHSRRKRILTRTPASSLQHPSTAPNTSVTSVRTRQS